jgi:hypothetical protein
MPTFLPTQDEREMVTDLGFRLVDSITLLGVDIKWDLSNVNNIFEKVRLKIINLASYWERFRLSLHGRIVIANTFLIAQLNYIACWLPVPDDI